MSASASAAAADTLRVALAGNPNCGKTTIFNALTGLRYKVANYPGVTVEKKSGTLTLPDGTSTVLIDLPGIYSLSGNSIDETIATRVLLGHVSTEPLPDLLIAVVDASNLERNLYLTSQLIDTGIPVIVALNMIDVATRRGILIRPEILSRRLGVPVIRLAASENIGLDELRRTVAGALQPAASAPSPAFQWLEAVSPYRTAALELGEFANRAEPPAWPIPPLLVGSSLLSESAGTRSPAIRERTAAARNALREAGIDPVSFEATARYRWINDIVKACCVLESTARARRSDRIDAIVTHRIWGTVIFFGIMTLIFQAIFLWSSAPMELIDSFVSGLGSRTAALMPDGLIESLVVDGVIAGVGSVLVFIPQIAILFFFLGVLEETGYLCRAAFLMDRIMRRFGLQGRSFIPLLSSFACAIPGILSTRSIPSFSDRLTTILIAPLMSCSARLPVYTVLIAAFIPDELVLGILSLQGLVLLAMYLLGIIGAAAVSWVLKATLLRGTPALFVMEMPPFRLPVIKVILRDVWDRIVLFLRSAGTVILACSIVLWFLASFPGKSVEESYAGKIGHFMEPAIKPLGYNWEIGVGLLASFAAREVFVSSLATVYNLEAGNDAAQPLVAALRERRERGTFTVASALSLMVFYVFACQCMSTLAVCRRETGSWTWVCFMFLYMGALAWVGAFITYRLAVAAGL